MNQDLGYCPGKVSIMLPTYARNYDGLLTAAIESALKQSYTDFELLIVDDCSVDGSADVIAQFSKLDHRVVHLRMPQRIGLPAMSTAQAFRQSRGEYIAWLFDDCEWKPNHLELLVAKAKENPQYGMVYGQCELLVADTSLVLGSAGTYQELQQGVNFIPNVAVLIPRAVFNDIGWLDPSVILKRFCDYDMWCRIAKKYPLGFVNKAIAIEKGGILPDSLGNSVSLCRELSLKYMRFDRNKYLEIANYDKWDPYQVLMDTTLEEKKQILKLSVEHISCTERYTDIKQLSWLTKEIFSAEDIKLIPANLQDDFINLLSGFLRYARNSNNLIKAKESRQIKIWLKKIFYKMPAWARSLVLIFLNWKRSQFYARG